MIEAKDLLEKVDELIKDFKKINGSRMFKIDIGTIPNGVSFEENFNRFRETGVWITDSSNFSKQGKLAGTIDDFKIIPVHENLEKAEEYLYLVKMNLEHLVKLK